LCPASKIWKYPYGIWNSVCRHHLSQYHLYLKVSLWDLKLVEEFYNKEEPPIFESIPMGFETLVYFHNDLIYIYLKVSLWDLKLTQAYQSCWTSMPIWKYPYGIWNFVSFYTPFLFYHLKVSLWDLKLGYCYGIVSVVWFESIPMGFETIIIHCLLRSSCIWKYPYGIWN